MIYKWLTPCPDQTWSPRSFGLCVGRYGWQMDRVQEGREGRERGVAMFGLQSPHLGSPEGGERLSSDYIVGTE